MNFMRNMIFLLSPLAHSCYNNSVYVNASVRASVRPSDFVRTIISAIVDGFQNDLTQLFSITCKCAIWNIHSGRPKVKVTREGQTFFRTITPTILDGFQYKFAQLFSIMSAIRRFILVGQRSRSCGLDELSLDNLLVLCLCITGINHATVCPSKVLYNPLSRKKILSRFTGTGLCLSVRPSTVQNICNLCHKLLLQVLSHIQWEFLIYNQNWLK